MWTLASQRKLVDCGPSASTGSGGYNARNCLRLYICKILQSSAFLGRKMFRNVVRDVVLKHYNNENGVPTRSPSK